MVRKQSSRSRPPRAGFTLPEALIASGVSVVLCAAVMTLFIWCGKQFVLCSKIAWSQVEGMNSGTELLCYLRNAKAIEGVDTNRGAWVKIRFPDGTLGTLSYSNSYQTLRDGRMYLQRTNGTVMIVARGLTQVMDSQGYTTPMFRTNRANSVTIAYRVSEPAASGTQAANDGDFAACVKFSACLRNSPAP